MHKYELIQSNGELKTTFYLPNSIKCPIYSLSSGCKGEIYYDANFKGYTCASKNCKYAVKAEAYINGQADFLK